MGHDGTLDTIGDDFRITDTHGHTQTHTDIHTHKHTHRHTRTHTDTHGHTPTHRDTHTDTHGHTLARLPKLCPRTKHINACYHHFCEHVRIGLIKILPVSTDDQTADILTKPLAQNSFCNTTSTCAVGKDPSIQLPFAKPL
jgi:hypothetical protein